MNGRRTYQELEESLDLLAAVVATYQSRIQQLEKGSLEKDETIARLEGMNEQYRLRLLYHENPNTPPSAQSLEWKAQKRQRRERRKEGGNGGGGGRPGRKRGHPGVSRAHAPERTEWHRFGGTDGEGRKARAMPECCGRPMRRARDRKRDIVDVVVVPTETRHRIETAVCASCGGRAEAPNDLPREGSYGKSVVGAISELRACRVPEEQIAVAMDSIFHVPMCTATVTNILGRVGDAVAGEADGIGRIVEASDVAGWDETSHNDNGTPSWLNVAQSGGHVRLNISRSRGTLLLDRLDRFMGVAITDGYRAYNRFNAEGKHQLCWAHELRQTRSLVDRIDAQNDEDVRARRRRFHGEMKSLYADAKLHAESPPSSRARPVMEHRMHGILDGFTGTPDAALQRVVDRLYRHLPHMFTFLEYAGVDPTNNASERALRHMVVFRKITGQTKGGDVAMRRLADFFSCALTWRNHGKRVAEEVARLI